MTIFGYRIIVLMLWVVTTSAQLAQLVEQRTENPCVFGSIPKLGMRKPVGVCTMERSYMCQPVFVFAKQLLLVCFERIMKTMAEEYHLNWKGGGEG